MADLVHAAEPGPTDRTASAGASSGLIALEYAVDATRPLHGAGGGLATFAARHHTTAKSDLIAVQVRPGWPPRAGALAQLAAATIPGLLLPLAHGPGPAANGGEAYYVICRPPPGPSLAAPGRSWSEQELIDLVLRPVAAALEGLRAKGITHRAIRPDNLFSAGPGEPAVLGCAWASPPGCLQPAVFEPPYSGMCLPAGRGEGTIADDVYALGVTLLTLALGRLPLADLDDIAMIRRKLDVGSFAALTGDARVPPMLGDLLRGMLAEDPAHRTPPSMLLDPAAARQRRLAARPARRATRPLQVLAMPAWDARGLAFAVAVQPEEGARLLRNGAVDDWLRRYLGDTILSARVEEALRLRGQDSGEDESRADAMLAMRAVAALDPLAPLCWRGLAVALDGFGPAIASTVTAGPQNDRARLQEILEVEAIGAWLTNAENHPDGTALRQQARMWRSWLRPRSLDGGMARVAYALNPLLPCASPLFAGRCVARLSDVLGALESISARADSRRLSPLDAHLAAFLVARQDLAGGSALLSDNAVSSAPPPLAVQIAALAALQRIDPRPLPGLATWLAEQAEPTLQDWHSRTRRESMRRQLQACAANGQLGRLLALLDDPEARRTDALGLRAATEAVARIDGELHHLQDGGAERGELARRLGHETAAATGLIALAITLGLAALG